MVNMAIDFEEERYYKRVLQIKLAKEAALEFNKKKKEEKEKVEEEKLKQLQEMQEKEREIIPDEFLFMPTSMHQQNNQMGQSNPLR